MNEILKINNVTKYYGSGSVVTKALDGISFTVEKGEFTAIMGASGSGKSTLLNVISTIDRVSSGDIYVGGQHLSEMKEEKLSVFRRDQLGFIFQEYNLLDTLTIGENIVLPLNLKKVSVEETEKELHRVAEALGVSDQLKKFPYELSGGQRQRAACARAIITNPALVLADEPTGNLDPHNAMEIMGLLEKINRRGTTVIVVTHSHEIVDLMKKRVITIDRGMVVCDEEESGYRYED